MCESGEGGICLKSRFTGPDARRPAEDTVTTEPPGSTENRLRQEVEEAFLQLRTPIFQYLRAIGSGPFQADEIVQEVFLRLLRGRHSGLEIKDVRGWAFRVARNLWIDSRREDQRFSSIDARDGTRPTADPAPDPERQLLRRERAGLLAAEVARLPELQRECLRLRREGHPYRDIAAVFNISAAVAADCVRQAVKTLKKRARW